ncbi:MAG: Rrf2 family transcriptional regulator [Treponema sp.]|jgi:Rrf2 family protein|nr:Rrf2 family transcriptional regulator [Treponema sp.]
MGLYGLRAMVDMALNPGDAFISLKSVAERQGIPQGYLEQIFAALKKAELLDGLTGSSGGYRLKHPADSITVQMVLYALEGDLSVVSRIPRREETALQRCIRDKLWDPINASTKEIIFRVLWRKSKSFRP